MSKITILHERIGLATANQSPSTLRQSFLLTTAERTELPSGALMLREALDNFSKSQDNVSHALSALQFKVIQNLGSGGFGEVLHVIDAVTQRQYALKHFKEESLYTAEKQTQQALLKQFEGSELEEVAAILEDSHDEYRVLLYARGECSLQNFSEARNAARLYWFENQQEFAFLVTRMADIIEVLLQHEVFHSDLKPENFVVLRHATDWRSHTLKIIDFGVSSINEFTNLLGRTPLYSEPGEGPRFFASRDERLLYEYYQFGRTLQRLMLDAVQSQINDDLQDQAVPRIQLDFSNDGQAIARTLTQLSRYYDEKFVALLRATLLTKTITSIYNAIAGVRNLPQRILQDEGGLLRTILADRLAEQKIGDSEQQLYSELEACVTLEMPQRGLAILDGANSRAHPTKREVLTYYRLKFLDLLGRNSDITEFYNRENEQGGLLYTLLQDTAVDELWKHRIRVLCVKALKIDYDENWLEHYLLREYLPYMEQRLQESDNEDDINALAEAYCNVAEAPHSGIEVFDNEKQFEEQILSASERGLRFLESHNVLQRGARLAKYFVQLKLNKIISYFYRREWQQGIIDEGIFDILEQKQLQNSYLHALALFTFAKSSHGEQQLAEQAGAQFAQAAHILENTLGKTSFYYNNVCKFSIVHTYFEWLSKGYYNTEEYALAVRFAENTICAQIENKLLQENLATSRRSASLNPYIMLAFLEGADLSEQFRQNGYVPLFKQVRDAHQYFVQRAVALEVQNRFKEAHLQLSFLIALYDALQSDNNKIFEEIDLPSVRSLIPVAQELLIRCEYKQYFFTRGDSKQAEVFLTKYEKSLLPYEVCMAKKVQIKNLLAHKKYKEALELIRHTEECYSLDDRFAEELKQKNDSVYLKALFSWKVSKIQVLRQNQQKKDSALEFYQLSTQVKASTTLRTALQQAKKGLEVLSRSELVALLRQMKNLHSIFTYYSNFVSALLGKVIAKPLTLWSGKNFSLYLDFTAILARQLKVDEELHKHLKYVEEWLLERAETRQPSEVLQHLPRVQDILSTVKGARQQLIKEELEKVRRRPASATNVQRTFDLRLQSLRQSVHEGLDLQALRQIDSLLEQQKQNPINLRALKNVRMRVQEQTVINKIKQRLGQDNKSTTSYKIW